MSEIEFKHISAGRDGSIWTASKADGTIHRLFGDAGHLGWIPDKDGKAEVIAAVDWGSIWCVNEKNEIWRLTDADIPSEGGKWTKVPTLSGRRDAKTIAVGTDDTVWYVQTNGVIIRQTQPGDGVGLGTWVRDKRLGKVKARDIAVHTQNDAWCVTKKGGIWHWTGKDWSEVETHNSRPDARTISVGNDGDVWYRAKGGGVYRNARPYEGRYELWKRDQSKNKERVGKVRVMAVAELDDVWCLNKRGEVWRTKDNKWRKLEADSPEKNIWQYTVKKGDGLLSVVRDEFELKEPKDTREINRLVNLIVAQNGIKNRNEINVGDRLTLRL